MEWLFSLKDIITTVVAIGGAVGVLYGWVVRPIKKQTELDRLQTEKIDAIQKKVDCIEKKVEANQAEYVRDRLQTLHHRYCTELKWASAEEKRRVIDWYDEYRARGYNHLAETYADDIIRLPEAPVNV